MSRRLILARAVRTVTGGDTAAHAERRRGSGLLTDRMIVSRLFDVSRYGSSSQRVTKRDRQPLARSPTVATPASCC